MTYTITYKHYDLNNYTHTYDNLEEAQDMVKRINAARCTVVSKNF